MMESVISTDGTRISYRRSGTGAPLVLVHGTLGSHASWTPVLPALERQFTVYALDRRGRGDSGDAASYALEREAEDVAAVVEAAGDGVTLLGHSYGGLCALEAALLTPKLHRLIVYEPSPLPSPGLPLYAHGIVDRFNALLAAGNREAVVTTMFRELVRVPPDELDVLRASPRFPAWMAAAHTVPRETLAEEEYRLAPDRFRSLQVPTLLLLGSDSPPFFKATIGAWHAILPNSGIVVLPDQQHLAMVTAPDLFVRVVLEAVAQSA